MCADKTVPAAQKIFFIAFLAHIVIAHTPAGKADLQAGATQPCLQANRNMCEKQIKIVAEGSDSIA